MKGAMYLAWSSDEQVLKKAECGGAVTALLKFALETKAVDAVLTVQPRDNNRYDGIPVLITNPAEVINSAGSLHCVSPNIARCLKEYLAGAAILKIAVTCKPCDARSIIEIAKRLKINMNNLILIGLNCTGTLPSTDAKQMFKQEFDVDPDEVVKEDIEDNKLTIELRDGRKIEKDLAELEEKGWGRRENCRRCEINIPVMADLACGKWGNDGKKQTFIEVCSDKGADFIQQAIKAEVIKVETPSAAAIETRKKKDKEAIELAKKWQERDFSQMRQISLQEKFGYWSSQFNQCIKCYGCRDACPICYCEDDKCHLEAKRELVSRGEVPPDILFPMVRIMHVVDSCVNCGQCQDACPVEIPLSRLIHMLQTELASTFSYEPGRDLTSRPPLRWAADEEIRIPEVELKLGT